MSREREDDDDRGRSGNKFKSVPVAQAGKGSVVQLRSGPDLFVVSAIVPGLNATVLNSLLDEKTLPIECFR